MSHALWCLALAWAAAPPVETSAEATTHLYVRTTPAGAQILLDGKQLGTSPGVFPVKPGQRRRLVIELDGQVAKEQQITIRDGRITRIELTLTPPDAKVESRSVGKKVSDFPEPVDLSTPESACAAYHRASAAMDLDSLFKLSWVTGDAKELWANLDPEDLALYNKALLEAEILKVVSYERELAAVISRLKFPPGEGRHPFSVRVFGRLDGKWRNLGEDRCSSLEAAVVIFSEKVDRHWQRFQGFRKMLAAAPMASTSPAKSPPPAADKPLSFGPVIERAVNDDDPKHGDRFIDFDTGKVLSPPIEEMERAQQSLEQWIVEAGVDAFGETKTSVRGLMGVDMIAIPISSERWNRISPNDVAEAVGLGKPGRPIPISGKGDLPATFIFQTREGGMGVLQILEFTKEPRGVKIRYKAVQSGGDEAAVREVISKFVEAVLQRDLPMAGTVLCAKTLFDLNKQLGEAREAIVAGLKMYAIEEVHVGQSLALAVTQFARHRDPQYKEPLCTVYCLNRSGTGWSIVGIDVEDEQGLADKIRHFRETAQQGGVNEPRKRKGDVVILTFEVDRESASDDQAIDIEDLLSAIGRRLDRGWVGRVEVRQVDAQRIEVVASTTDPEQVRRIERLVACPGTIEFRILANDRDHKELIERAQKEDDRRLLNPDGTLAAWWVAVASGQEEGSWKHGSTVTRKIQEDARQALEVLVVADPFDVTDAYLVEAISILDTSGRTSVGFTFDTRGGQLLGGLTGANLPDKSPDNSGDFSRHLGIILNGQLHSAPAIRSTIRERGEISGDFTREEVEDLVNVLNTGPLPMPLEKVSEVRTSQ